MSSDFSISQNVCCQPHLEIDFCGTAWKALRLSFSHLISFQNSIWEKLAKVVLECFPNYSTEITEMYTRLIN
jgi:hypothetical protein